MDEPVGRPGVFSSRPALIGRRPVSKLLSEIKCDILLLPGRGH